MAGRDLRACDRKTLTCGQVAREIDCSAAYAAGLIDSGELEGWRLPGGQRRTTPRALADWMRRHGVPLRLFGLTGRRRLLLASADESLARRLASDCHERLDVLRARTWFEAGSAWEREAPHLLVLDCDLGRAEALAVPGRLAGSRLLCRAALLATEDAPPPEVGTPGVTVFARPFDPTALSAWAAGGGDDDAD